ncbi:MAG: dockerin type I domain-containing protein [Pseudomonadota bacterium]
MKTQVLCLLVSGIILCCSNAFALENESIRGDINDNGVVDIIDESLALQAITAKTSADQNSMPRSDVNQDGKIGLAEAIYILHIASNLRTAEPIPYPTADPGFTQDVMPGDLVILDASRYTDPTGQVLTYAWSQTHGTPVTLSDPTLPILYIDAPSLTVDTQELIFSLTVTNAEGLSNSAAVSVMVHKTLPEVPKSTIGLIDEAVQKGIITEDKGLIYKVFALFGDSRFPEIYRGSSLDMIDGTDTMVALNYRYEGMSPEDKAQIYPYLLPLYVDGSWYELRKASNVTQSFRTTTATTPAATVWKSVGTDKVKVWYEDGKEVIRDGVTTSYADIANGVLTAVTSKIWPRLFELMDKEPLSDKDMVPRPLPSPDYGKIPGNYDQSGALDIILARGMNASGYTVPYHAAPTPVFITIDIAMWPLGNETTPGLIQIAAHELMHAWQFGYPLKDSPPSYSWLMEATAAWTEDYIYPRANSENRYAKWFLDTTHLSIDDQTNFRQYGLYSPFSFWTNGESAKAPPEMVKNTWVNAATLDSMAAVDQSYPPPLTEPLPRQFNAIFERFWADALVAAWNQGADGYFFKKDKLATGAKVMRNTPTRIALNGAMEKMYYLNDLDSSGKIELPYLSARFYRFVFTDDSARTVVFYDGLRSKLRKMPADDGTVIHMNEPFLPDLSHPLADPAEGAQWRLIAKIAGQWKEWTIPFGINTGRVVFSRDAKAERLQELVILLANSSPDKTRVIKPTGLAPALLVSNIASFGWDGTITATNKDSSSGSTQEKITAIVKFRRGQDVYPGSFPKYVTPAGVFVLKSGSFHWEINESFGDCTSQGQDAWSWSAPAGGSVQNGPDAGMLIYPEALSGAMYRKLVGDGDTGDHACQYTIKCKDQPPSTVEKNPTWWDSDDGEGLPEVTSAGNRLTGSVVVSDTLYEWNLIAVHEN